MEVGGRHKIDDVALIERRDREIERLLDALMQEKRENARLRGRVDQLKELDDLSRREIESLTQKVLLLESVGQRMSLGYDDLENRKEELCEENERLREALRNAYQDCLDAVAKVKADPLTEAGFNHKSQYGNISAKDWMVAFAEDVEREIKGRAALGEEK